MDGLKGAPRVPEETNTDARLIERWLPIAALGEESVRERRFSLAGKVLPPNNSLHVWWARRPLIASRAAVLASVLSGDTPHELFLKSIGILGDPVAARRRNNAKLRAGQIPLGEAEYGYPRAFRHTVTRQNQEQLERYGWRKDLSVLDPTAGGGAIPSEAARLGLTTLANDLNPVAALIEKATIEYPLRHGSALAPAFKQLASEFIELAIPKFEGVFPNEPPGTQVLAYVWARTIRCPHCEGLVPLSPNWRLAPDGAGVRLVPHTQSGPGDIGRRCSFEIVGTVKEQSDGTASDGDGLCPFPDCKRVIPNAIIKAQAQADGMGDQLFAVIFKRRAETRTKEGKRGRDKWERCYRAPTPEDDNSAEIAARVAEMIPEWEALDLVPSEALPMDSESWTHGNTPAQFGATKFTDLFSPRQLLGHTTGVEVFRKLLAEREQQGRLDEISKAAFVYLAFCIDKMLDYSSRASRWEVVKGAIGNTFARHDFAFRWSYAEMAQAVTGLGYQWVIGQVGKCIEELVELARPDLADEGHLLRAAAPIKAPVTITCGSADQLLHVEDDSVDVIVMDPPYYDNVMYAELSDFFYVWLKRTAGQVVPELFTRRLTDKDNEAIANIAKFDGQKGAKVLAGRDYQQRMARIFEECRRVLKFNGIMTLMFTHKATGAWDALTKGLMEAGFVITASWPINTEAEGSLHIKNKSAANSTIFLVCRPREARPVDGGVLEYWEDVEPLVARAVRRRVEEFQKAGVGGVDLYLACFGPALEEFSRHWPLKRATPRPFPDAKKRQRQTALFEEEFDLYAVTPEDALEAARQEVKRWRLEQLARKSANGALDPLTSFFVLAWDAFEAPQFPYDEGLRLARAVGVDLDLQVVGVLAEKKGSALILWDSAKRAAKAALGAPDGSRAMVDALHHVAHVARAKTLIAAQKMAEHMGLLANPAFQQALTYALEVLPPSRTFSGLTLEGELAAAAGDFEVLENLRRLALSDRVPEPEQLKLFVGEMT